MHSNPLRIRLHFGGTPPAWVVAWLWLGVGTLLLLYLRSILSTTSQQLDLNLGLGELLRRPILLGLSMRQVFVLVNSLFVIYLWATYRNRTRLRARVGLRALLFVGTAAVIVLFQWAFVSLENALPPLYVIQVYP